LFFPRIFDDAAPRWAPNNFIRYRCFKNIYFLFLNFILLVLDINSQSHLYIMTLLLLIIWYD